MQAYVVCVRGLPAYPMKGKEHRYAVLASNRACALAAISDHLRYGSIAELTDEVLRAERVEQLGLLPGKPKLL
ncbi:hypothetical protein [Methylobacterium oxalidis]|uniref:Uncharacterized protein n=1 Tax=Methylobacterium oxalidis TaxID=944322 RepID=A0A512IZK7_9HYPH|nr:hypothetical protein [Methylobacterium oxalidis]GEP03140.1 hypothetical protein MOX02_11780 [Methylobacterium oxalidis]GJE31481.1 hypothetical protein LDDCCGHA_1660 [Methylobacterium oxalidis]GLS67399.1 hypothetical protein GCM10007888_57830 [Methylobacterium oxalidis]